MKMERLGQAVAGLGRHVDYFSSSRYCVSLSVFPILNSPAPTVFCSDLGIAMVFMGSVQRKYLLYRHPYAIKNQGKPRNAGIKNQPKLAGGAIPWINSRHHVEKTVFWILGVEQVCQTLYL